MPQETNWQRWNSPSWMMLAFKRWLY